MAAMNPLEIAAQLYAEQGWHVFPLKPGEKTPATRNGLHDATLDANQIRGWWERQPDANIGINCGLAGLTVIDIDLRHGDGFKAWGDIQRTAKGDPTWETETPSGGAHIYYTTPPDATIRNSAGRLAANIDVRADGGYVVAAPSTTPQGVYTVTDDRDPILLPPWLLELLEAPQIAINVPRPTVTPIAGDTPYGTAALTAETDNIATAVEGQRNDQLNRSAYAIGQLIAGRQLDATHAIAALETAALASGLGQTETTRTLDSGIRSGLQNPRTP
jgi:hypothetical protein